jgi:hypothetical protein
MDPSGFVLNKDASEKLVDWDSSGGGSLPSDGGLSSDQFDLAKIQNIMAMADKFRTGNESKDPRVWNPEFHQALYGRSEQIPGPNFIDNHVSDIEKKGKQATFMILGGMGAGAAGVAGAEGAGIAGAGGELGGMVSSLFGGGGGDIAAIGKLIGMAGGGGDGGGGDIAQLVKVISELVTIMKGQQGNDKQVSDPTNSNFGPSSQSLGRRQQGSNYGAIARNTGR